MRVGLLYSRAVLADNPPMLRDAKALGGGTQGESGTAVRLAMAKVLGLVWLIALSVAMPACKREDGRPATERPPSLDRTRALETLDPAALAASRGGSERPGIEQPPVVKPDNSPLRVTEVGPKGVTSNWPDAFIEFSAPIWELGSPPEVDLKALGLKITPTLRGEWMWASPNRLVFSPRAELPAASIYRVTANGEVRAYDGRSVKLNVDFSFETDRPTATIETLSGLEGNTEEDALHWKSAFVVQTTQGVRAEDLRRAIHAYKVNDKGELGASIPVSISRQRRDRWGYLQDDPEYQSYVVRPAATWPLGSQIVIEVDGGLRGRHGPLTMGAPVRRSFMINRGLEITGVHCYDEFVGGCGLGPVTLEFRTPVPGAAILNNVRLEGVSRGGRAKGWDEGWDDDAYGQRRGFSSALVWGNVELGKSYVVRASGALRDVYGQPLVGGPYKKEVRYVVPQPSLELQPTHGVIDPTRGTSIGIEARWIERVEVRWVSLPLREGASWSRLDLKDLNTRAWPTYALAEGRTEQDLVMQGDFAWASVELPLRQLSPDLTGPIPVEVRPLRGKSSPWLGTTELPAAKRAIVQLSEFNAYVIATLPKSAVYVASTSTAEPARDVIVRARDEGGKLLGTVRTDAAGIATLPDEAGLERGRLTLLEFNRGNARYVLPTTALKRDPASPEPDSPHGLRRGERSLVTATTERALYRPGERVHFVAWTAVASPYTAAGLERMAKGTPAHVVVRDYSSEQVVAKDVKVSASGKAYGTLTLPQSARLGRYTLSVEVLGTTSKADFSVEDYRVPDFEVAAAIPTPDLTHGQVVRLIANARYYFGGATKIIGARALTNCTNINFRPSGLEAGWIAGWHREPTPKRGGSAPLIPSLRGDQVVEGRDDGAWDSGHLESQLFTTPGLLGVPYGCTSSVAVRDATQQEVGAEASFTVHPDFYLATLPGPGDRAPHSIQVPARVVTYNGERLEQRVKVSLHRTWEAETTAMVDGQSVVTKWETKEEDLPSCTVNSTREGADGACRFAELKYGRYTVTLASTGSRHDATVSYSIYVSRPHRPQVYVQRSRPPRLQLSIDDRNLEVGDAAIVNIAGPTDKGHGVLVVINGGIRSILPFQLKDGNTTLEIPVDESMVPSAQLRAFMVDGASAGTRNAIQESSATIKTSTRHRELSVDVVGPGVAGPRDEVTFTVNVRDYQGKPTSGHVTLWAVDEAVLALKEHTLPELIAAFAVERTMDALSVNGFMLAQLPYVRRSDPYSPQMWTPDAFATFGSSYGYGAGGGGFGGRGAHSPSIRMASAETARERFDSAPIFIGDAMVGKDGIAKVKGTMPDNLTTFRVTAIASSSIQDAPVGRFGHATTQLRVTRPMVLRPVIPRIMRSGDRAQIFALVDNLAAPAGELEVRLELLDADDVLALDSPTVSRTAFAVGAQSRLGFQVRAIAPGPSRVKMSATLTPADGSAVVRDTVILPLPVEVERTQTDTVAVYGELNDDTPVALPFKLPDGVVAEHGGLTLDVSATLLTGLRDAVTYLVRYPYGCAEQTSSRLVPIIALGELATQFDLGDQSQLDELYLAGVTRLASFQRADGSFGYWGSQSGSYPHVSAYVAWVLDRAQKAGRPVPAEVIRGYLAFLREHLNRTASIVAPSPDVDTASLIALLILDSENSTTVLASDVKVIDSLWEREKQLGYTSRVLLLQVLHRRGLAAGGDPRAAQLLEELLAFVDRRNDSARVELSSRNWWLFESDGRSTAMLLSALIEVDPQHALVPALARGLMDSQQAGRWSNTQENAYAIIAMTDYAKIYEAESPDFRGNIWLGQDRVAQVAIKDDRFAQAHGEAPMQRLIQASGTPSSAAPGTSTPLILERIGTGRMYYRIGLTWASLTGADKAVDRGLSLEHSLRSQQASLSLDTPLKLGEIYALDVTLTTSSSLTFVAAELPLPAGIEAINLELGRGSAAMKIAGRRGSWVSHQELHRDRVLLFADKLEPGTHTTTIFVRATTLGDFAMPPASAHMMYYPEVYGRSPQRALKVEP